MKATLVSALLVASASAHADSPARTATPAPPAPIDVSVRGPIDPALLSTSIASELARPVTQLPGSAACHAPCLAIAVDDAAATITFTTADGVTRQRTIALPADRTQWPVLVTLLGSRDLGALPLRHLAAPLTIIALGIVLINADLFGAAPSGDPLLKGMGVLCAVVALFSWGFYAVHNSRWLMRVHHVSSQDWSLLTGIVTGALALVLAVPAFALGQSHSSHDWQVFWGFNLVLATTARWSSTFRMPLSIFISDKAETMAAMPRD